ncbi:MAG TPA: Clp protease N-terminal domain-containing protein, partial [Gaiellaceae bacterium]|nr:Clp protease N-terminal domain-containing protein [Gaiellaceae bacterium]
MDFNRLTLKAQEAVQAAVQDARRRGNPEVYPEHLLLALLEQELPRTLVERASASVDLLREAAETRIERAPAIQGAQQQPAISQALLRVFDKADEERTTLDDEYVSTEH